MIPNTNIHKIVGYVVGVLVGWAANKGFEIDPEWQASLTLGVALFVSALVAKVTNPTGANTSEARKTLEAVVESKH